MQSPNFHAPAADQEVADPTADHDDHQQRQTRREALGQR